MPDAGRRAAAGDLLHRRVVVLADPDGGDEAAGVADEPGVPVVAGGAGLAGQVVARRPGPACRCRRPAPGASSGSCSPAPAGRSPRGARPCRRRGRRAPGRWRCGCARCRSPWRRRRRWRTAHRPGPSPAGSTSTAPSAMDGSSWIGEVMPSRRAVAATLAVPTSLASRAATVLIDCASAVCRVIGPEVAAGVVARRPVADGDRLVDHRGVGRAAGLHGGQVDEGLEGRAGLAPGHGGAVELASAGSWCRRRRRGRGPRRRGRPARPAATPWFLRRRRRRPAAACSAAACSGRSSVVSTTRSSVGSPTSGRTWSSTQSVKYCARWLASTGFTRTLVREGLVALGRRDEALLDHLVEHDGGAARGAVGGGHRRIARRALHHPGQQRALAQGQLRGGLVEIALRGGLDAVGAGAEIDPVQVELEDLLLGELGLQPDRQDQLLGLAPVGLVRASGRGCAPAAG